MTAIKSENSIIEKFHIFSDKTALIYKGREYSYEDLIRRIDEIRKLLAEKNVKSGQVVAICSDYCFESIALFLALLEAKNIIVPITNTVSAEKAEKMKEAYVDWAAEVAGNKIKLKRCSFGADKHDLIKKLQKSNSSGLILFSSGSSGKPKAMIHNLDNMSNIYFDKDERNNRMLAFLLFDHIGGINTLFNALFRGCALCIPVDRDVDRICSLIEKHKLNVLPASPTFLNLMLISKAYKNYGLGFLTLITYGAEPMPEALLKNINAVLPKVKFLQTFGTSETGIARTSSKSSDSILLKIDDPNTKYKVVNGELWLKSSTQVLGYLNSAMDNFTSDGWYKTGDIVEYFKDGYLKVIGRNNTMINVGGQKVLPEEVESEVLKVPGIADCIIYGERNPILGQIVVADVVLHKKCDCETVKKKIRLFCKDKMDSYKLPVKVNVVKQIKHSGRFKKFRKAVGSAAGN